MFDFSEPSNAIQSNILNTNLSNHKKLSILLVSDFFYPRLGGVELHQYQLAFALRRRGHKITILTGTYTKKTNGDRFYKRQGIRYLKCGIKIIYLPLVNFIQQASLPSFFVNSIIFRNILINEKIDLIHSHQATSSLGHECLLHSATLNKPSLYTDHSLFTFKSFASLQLNRILQFTLYQTTSCICVSNCSKENLILRTGIEKEKIYVIPNAFDSFQFKPASENESNCKISTHKPLLHAVNQYDVSGDTSNRITIIVLSRLVYRKGVDLLLDVIPEICLKYPNVDFLVGGDGPKKISLMEVCERYSLESRVKLVGSVDHENVRSILIKGDIFLNCSLTEAFCIAILEAVSCGLLCVATNVGGVSEILPPNLILFAKPKSSEIIKVLSRAIESIRLEKSNNKQNNIEFRWKQHRKVREMYSWHSIAERTEIVYYDTINRFYSKARNRTVNQRLLERLKRYQDCGPISGLLFAFIALLDHLLYLFIDYFYPIEEFELPNGKASG